MQNSFVLFALAILSRTILSDCKIVEGHIKTLEVNFLDKLESGDYYYVSFIYFRIGFMYPDSVFCRNMDGMSITSNMRRNMATFNCYSITTNHINGKTFIKLIRFLLMMGLSIEWFYNISIISDLPRKDVCVEHNRQPSCHSLSSLTIFP
jgi:hypothetical protein